MYGPVCTVVWEGEAVRLSPIPIGDMISFARPAIADADDIIVSNNTRHASGYFRGRMMQISANLNKKITQAVQTSMRIEGYEPVRSAAIKQQAQALMEQHRVQVSLHRK